MIKITHRKTAACGALLCLFAVAIGAFGSHAFSDLLAANQRQNVFELANRYQFYHGLALMAIAALYQHNKPTDRSLNTVSCLMVIGVIIFSGSLYALALTNVSILGAITPIGGVMFIVAWALLSWQILRPSQA